jgi:cysteine desulfurase
VHLGARIVPVAPNGVVDLDALASLLDPSVGLVSLMAANNEVGVVQPLAEAVSLVRELAPGAVVHTDAVHAAPWLDLAELSRDVDLVSLSAHKFQGPKGAGILAIRGSVEGIVPRGFGGSQERDLRPGTQDVAAIAGMAAALRATASRRASEAARVGALRDRLADGLRAALEGVVETGEGESGRSHKVPGSCHLCIEGVEAQELLVLLDQMGVAASVGSSCASGATQPSHVLAAMGVPPGLARGAVRFSLGHGSRSEEVDHALDVVPEAVGRLRGKRRSS